MPRDKMPSYKNEIALFLSVFLPSGSIVALAT